MTEPILKERFDQKESLSVPLFGYELIREELITDLLGKDTPDLLYWAGKRLARKYPLTDYDDVIGFFDKAGWGLLTIKNNKKNEVIFELESELIKERLKTNPNSTYHLEAGFLAQQIEFQTEVITEAFEHPRKKAAKVQFTVKWDLADPIEK